MSLDPAAYRAARELRGSQSEVAEFLRVSKATIHRRESGKIAITHEATLALLSMPPKKKAEPITPGVDIPGQLQLPEGTQ